MEEKTCSSCKHKIVNDKGGASFPCPQCGEYEIVRCSACRVNAVQYTCPSCQFVGPN